jgi:hypothetical protein
VETAEHDILFPFARLGVTDGEKGGERAARCGNKEREICVYREETRPLERRGFASLFSAPLLFCEAQRGGGMSKKHDNIDETIEEDR